MNDHHNNGYNDSRDNSPSGRDGPSFLALYRWLTSLGGPVLAGYLRWRLLRGKEDPVRFNERLGQPGRPRPFGPLVWLHAASVGESLSVLPLINAMLAERPALSVLMTTGSVSSARLMAERLPDRACHQYIPVDRVSFLERFLNHWRPGLVLWAESEFWPNTILEIRRRAIPLVLVNGRMSSRSFRRWQKWPREIGLVLAAFDLCLAQSTQDGHRLSTLGAPRVACAGNLKFAAPPLPADPEILARLQDSLTGRLVWLAASTHAGEEAAVGRIHRRLVRLYPGLLTLIVPRHPFRGASIAAELAAAGLQVARRCAGETVQAGTDIYLADTLGELGLFFRLAPVVFMGKSLVPHGGQNPLEPACLGCTVLFGPHMDNFMDITTRMVAAGAARIVADEEGLATVVAALLADAATRLAMGTAARAFATAEVQTLPRLLARLAPCLENLAPLEAAIRRNGHARA